MIAGVLRGAGVRGQPGLAADGPEFIGRRQSAGRLVQRAELDLDLLRIVVPAEQLRAAVRAEPVAARAAAPAAELARQDEAGARPVGEEREGRPRLLAAGLAMADADADRVALKLEADLSAGAAAG